MSQTVKARVHHGAKSLDLTIPTNLCRKYNIAAGDVFEVSVEEGEGRMVIAYRRVYSAKSKSR